MKLTEAAELLCSSGIENALYEARLLFSHFGGYRSYELIGSDPNSELEALIAAVKKRAQRYPLQYIIGEVDFYRERYKVSESCLIPRSDTEILVDEVIKRLPDGALILDLCTGSGCIALSILNNTKGTTAIAVDISEDALDVARSNAEALSLTERISFLQADALGTAVCDKAFAVISNPPYVTEEEYTSLEPEIYFEPSIAFLAKKNGIDFYERIVPEYANAISEEGFFAFEIGYTQADALRLVAKRQNLRCEIIKDYSGNDRVAILFR